MNYEDLKYLEYLAVPLPEDVLKERWSGHFEKARKIIAERMKDESISDIIKKRLELELNNIKITEARYTVTKENGLKQVQQKIPSFTMDELDKLQLEGKIDYMYIEDEIKYANSFCSTLFKVYPDIWNRYEKGDERDYSAIDNMIEDLVDGQEIACHIHIRQILKVLPHAIRQGEIIKAHMPLPCQGEHVKNLKIYEITPNPQKMPSIEEDQATVYFELPICDEQEFKIEYEFDNVRKYIDLSKVDLDKINEGNIPDEIIEYTQQQLPHMQFTPYLKALAKEIKGTDTNPLIIARKIYDYVTTKTDYRFVRDYAGIDNLSEYCAINRRGDCGVEALLFITLCRICGVPAKWESGLDAKPNDVGQHDWAMFYIPLIGWLYADLSYGGAAYVRGATKRWNYYFGNVDPYRIPINKEFQKQFVPPKKHIRVDPYDNQCGEAEYEDFGLRDEDLAHKYEKIDIKRIK